MPLPWCTAANPATTTSGAPCLSPTKNRQKLGKGHVHGPWVGGHLSPQHTSRRCGEYRVEGAQDAMGSLQNGAGGVLRVRHAVTSTWAGRVIDHLSIEPNIFDFRVEIGGKCTEIGPIKLQQNCFLIWEDSPRGESPGTSRSSITPGLPTVQLAIGMQRQVRRK
ncbi:hypothetical protein C8R44DRAFT_725044 [Mycena epipterygia]|nr:hypothetical protein C8R44DRAFT_725044 [Mycena epipterygia]